MITPEPFNPRQFVVPVGPRIEPIGIEPKDASAVAGVVTSRVQFPGTVDNAVNVNLLPVMAPPTDKVCAVGLIVICESLPKPETEEFAN